MLKLNSGFSVSLGLVWLIELCLDVKELFLYLPNGCIALILSNMG